MLPDDGGGVVGDKQLLNVVDDHLVHAVGTVTGLDCLGEVFARRDVSDDGLLKT